MQIFNLQGQVVRILVDEIKQAGEHTAFWDGRSDDGGIVASGVYVYKLQTEDQVKSRKMLYLR